jgi:hypothetical protein
LVVAAWLVAAPGVPAAGEGPRLGDGRAAVLAGIVALDPGAVAAEVTLLDATAPTLDRHGRVRAQLRGPDGAWIQADLVGQGLALVAPAADVPPEQLAELLRLEREARDAGRGRWAAGGLGPYPAEAIAASPGSFILVRGTVRTVGRRGEMTYLDFGADWRRDFTIRAETRQLVPFAKAGLDVAGLGGKRILVRGWLFENAGPMIELVHPLQVEVEE